MERLSLFEARFPAGPQGAGEARRALAGIEGRFPGRVYSAVRLLVSELVSNAQRHPIAGAQALVRVRVQTDASLVRVELRNLREADPLASTDEREAAGWDLYLLREMPERWGILFGSTSDVWFEFDVNR